MVKNKILKRIVAGLSCIALSTTMLTSLPAFADDYVDEYQYYSTLDPNGEEYQEWKSNLASSAVSVPQNRMLKSILKNNTLIANDYIEFNTASNGHYTIGTIGGNPNSSTDDNKKMLFGHPGGGTSKTTIVVGESINEFTSSNVTYDADGSKSVSKASYDGVDVTQELSIIENSATGRDDVVKIKYIVKNDTEYAKQVGIRIMMDTMLGGNDAAPFRVNGSDVTTETVYSGSNIPQIWQAFDSATNPGVVAHSVVPIESATMNFNHDLLDIKIFDQDHMGLIQSQECIDEILKNIKDTKSFMKLPMRTKMANNNLTSNAIEETKTLSNKLAISGYFDLFFSNETCSYYYTNSEVHEGNNFKFDPLTSVGNPILLAQFADDNYDCKINSLADQNTDIMCNIDGNIYLYTNISVNSGSVLFLNLSDGSFFINIDLDNDGEIDTTVTPTINPGVIQDDEKSPEITVESCNAGISNSNTINPNIVITNNSDKPLKMSDITINYVFNADNKENLEYHCDWLAVDNQYLGNTSVCEFVNDDYGNTYAKIKFNTDVELQPNKQFVIHFRLNAADWSNWDTSNDYSMGTEQLLPNDKIIVFYNEQLISGVQP